MFVPPFLPAHTTSITALTPSWSNNLSKAHIPSQLPARPLACPHTVDVHYEAATGPCLHLHTQTCPLLSPVNITPWLYCDASDRIGVHAISRGNFTSPRSPKEGSSHSPMLPLP